MTFSQLHGQRHVLLLCGSEVEDAGTAEEALAYSVAEHALHIVGNTPGDVVSAA